MRGHSENSSRPKVVGPAEPKFVALSGHRVSLLEIGSFLRLTFHFAILDPAIILFLSSLILLLRRRGL
jgi:hypothetical protein